MRTSTSRVRRLFRDHEPLVRSGWLVDRCGYPTPPWCEHAPCLPTESLSVPSAQTPTLPLPDPKSSVVGAEDELPESSQPKLPQKPA